MVVSLSTIFDACTVIRVRYRIIRRRIRKLFGTIKAVPRNLRYKLFPRDTPRALNAMEVANAHLAELREHGDLEPHDRLRIASLATKQIRKAEWFDPDAILNTDEPDLNQTLTVAKLKTHALQEEARARAANGQLDKAADCLRSAINIAPSDSFLYYGLGLVLIDDAQKNGAVRALKRAVRLQPNNVEYRRALDEARNLSRSAKAIRSTASTVSGFIAVLRYAIFALILWAIYALAIQPAYTVANAKEESFLQYIILIAFHWLIIILALRLVLEFFAWVIGASLADLYISITRIFRR